MRLHRSIILAGCVAAAIATCPIASAQAVQPGEWSLTTTIKSMEMKGLTPAMANVMKEPTTSESCVTPEKAAKGLAELTSKNGGDCVIKSQSITGGVLDAQATCGTGGDAMNMHLHGPFSTTSYSLTTESSRGGAKPMKTIIQMDAKRTGACH